MIKNFFRSIDDKLTTVEDYIDLRVRSGKFVADIPILSNLISEKTQEGVSRSWNSFYQSPAIQSVVSRANKLYQAAMRIPVLNTIINLFTDGIRVLSWGFLEIIINTALALYSIFLLVVLFQNSPVLFFIFLPILFFTNLYFKNALYIYLEKKLKHTGINWLSAATEAWKHVPTVFITTGYVLSLILGGIIFFFIFSLFYSFLFDYLSIEWGKSFYYWIVIVILTIAIAFFVFILCILLPYILFFIILDKKSSHQAFETSIKFLKAYPIHILTYNFILIASCILFGIWAITKYYYIGVGITFLAYHHGNFFLAYLLRRKFIEKTPITQNDNLSNNNFLLIFIPLIGITTYALSAAFIMKNYKEIDRMFTVTQAIEFDTYHNEKHKYQINYPKGWTSYGPTNQDEITIYNNETETSIGGVWIKVTVKPKSSEFDTLYKIKPGEGFYETVTNNITTKVTNLSTHGFKTVKYTFVKNEATHTEYQIHYLVQKDDKEYDIELDTINKEIEGQNLELFDLVYNSFTFTDQ